MVEADLPSLRAISLRLQPEAFICAIFTRSSSSKCLYSMRKLARFRDEFPSQGVALSL